MKCILNIIFVDIRASFLFIETIGYLQVTTALVTTVTSIVWNVLRKYGIYGGSGKNGSTDG